MSEPSTPAATKAVAQTREPSLSRGFQDRSSQSFQGEGVDYVIGAGVARAASVTTYERKQNDPIYRPLQVYTLDPAALSAEGARTVLDIPYEPLEPGPVGSLFEVDSRGASFPVVPVDLEDPKLLITQGLAPSPSNYQFHHQMVYAVSSSLYAAFRTALGRPVAWGFDCGSSDGINRLRLRPY